MGHMRRCGIVSSRRCSVRPNPPIYCTGCGIPIPNRKDRRGSWCRKCSVQFRRCSQCGQLVSPGKQHACASVDLCGQRFCNQCGVPLKNEGYERWKRSCPRCEKKRWRDKERAERASLKAAFGGQCQICGYSRCQTALQFHHRNGRRQDQGRGSVKVREVRLYPERFELLCANCHFETHHPGE